MIRFCWHRWSAWSEVTKAPSGRWVQYRYCHKCRCADSRAVPLPEA